MASAAAVSGPGRQTAAALRRAAAGGGCAAESGSERATQRCNPSGQVKAKLGDASTDQRDAGYARGQAGGGNVFKMGDDGHDECV